MNYCNISLKLKKKSYFYVDAFQNFWFFTPEGLLAFFLAQGLLLGGCVLTGKIIKGWF